MEVNQVGKKAAGRLLDGRTCDEYPNGDAGTGAQRRDSAVRA